MGNRAQGRDELSSLKRRFPPLDAARRGAKLRLRSELI